MRLPKLSCCAGASLLLLVGCEGNGDPGDSTSDGSEASTEETTSDEFEAALDELVIPTQAELDEAAASSIDASNEDAEFEALWDEVMNDDG